MTKNDILSTKVMANIIAPFLLTTLLSSLFLQSESRKSPPLRIAIVPPIVEAIPPKRYGGTERIVHYLTEELVKRGHNVTLFASGDSVTSARLFTNKQWPALWNRQKLANAAPEWVPRQWTLEQVQRHASEFDILHFHTDEHFNIVRHVGIHRTVTTLHKPTSVPGFEQLIQLFPEMPLVSVSADQQTHIQFRPNFVATVHLGIPDQLHFREMPEGDPVDGQPYLAFLGRISPLKGPDMAIEIAVKAGIRLLIAAKVDDDEQYWKEKIKPMIDRHPELVKFVGEINETQKSDFLGNALALIFPIDWDEPFGTVMIEAMSTGTPVIAKARGSVKEVIKEGVTGLLFTSVDEGVQAAHKAANLDRRAIRREFERRFTVDKMVDNYERVYQQILANQPTGEQKAQQQAEQQRTSQCP